jgi:lysozyme family protein
VIAGVGAGIVVLGIALHARNAEASTMSSRVNPSTKLADLRGEYAAMYAAAQIRPERLASVDALVSTLASHRDRYEGLSRDTGVPWYVIAILHAMEGGGSSGRFTGHLHNGDTLARRTTSYPPNRPVAPPAAGEGQPYTWEESGRDALSRWRGVTDWSLPATLWRLEGYNGFGTRARGIQTPYLWSYTDQYAKGKYVADGVWDANAVSRQVGAAAILKRMEQRGLIVIPT